MSDNKLAKIDELEISPFDAKELAKFEVAKVKKNSAFKGFLTGAGVVAVIGLGLFVRSEKTKAVPTPVKLPVPANTPEQIRQDVTQPLYGNADAVFKNLKQGWSEPKINPKTGDSIPAKTWDRLYGYTEVTTIKGKDIEKFIQGQHTNLVEKILPAFLEFNQNETLRAQLKEGAEPVAEAVVADKAKGQKVAANAKASDKSAAAKLKETENKNGKTEKPKADPNNPLENGTVLDFVKERVNADNYRRKAAWHNKYLKQFDNSLPKAKKDLAAAKKAIEHLNDQIVQNDRAKPENDGLFKRILFNDNRFQSNKIIENNRLVNLKEQQLEIISQSERVIKRRDQHATLAGFYTGKSKDSMKIADVLAAAINAKQAQDAVVLKEQLAEQARKKAEKELQNLAAQGPYMMMPSPVMGYKKLALQQQYGLVTQQSFDKKIPPFFPNVNIVPANPADFRTVPNTAETSMRIQPYAVPPASSEVSEAPAQADDAAVSETAKTPAVIQPAKAAVKPEPVAAPTRLPAPAPSMRGRSDVEKPTATMQPAGFTKRLGSKLSALTADLIFAVKTPKEYKKSLVVSL